MPKTILEGSLNHFGPRTSEVDNAAYIPNNLVETLVQPLITVPGSAVLTAVAAAEDTVNKIPANSLVKRAYIYVEDAFTAVTAASITVGIPGLVDGIVDAAGTVGAVANLTANSWAEGDGSVLGISVGAADAEVVAAWNVADVTATGTAVLVVEYIPPLTQYLG